MAATLPLPCVLYKKDLSPQRQVDLLSYSAAVVAHLTADGGVRHGGFEYVGPYRLLARNASNTLGLIEGDGPTGGLFLVKPN